MSSFPQSLVCTDLRIHVQDHSLRNEDIQRWCQEKNLLSIKYERTDLGYDSKLKLVGGIVGFNSDTLQCFSYNDDWVDPASFPLHCPSVWHGLTRCLKLHTLQFKAPSSEVEVDTLEQLVPRLRMLDITAKLMADMDSWEVSSNTLEKLRSQSVVNSDGNPVKLVLNTPNLRELEVLEAEVELENTPKLCMLKLMDDVAMCRVDVHYDLPNLKLLHLDAKEDRNLGNWDADDLEALLKHTPAVEELLLKVPVSLEPNRLMELLPELRRLFVPEEEMKRFTTGKVVVEDSLEEEWEIDFDTGMPPMD